MVRWTEFQLKKDRIILNNKQLKNLLIKLLSLTKRPN